MADADRTGSRPDNTRARSADSRPNSEAPDPEFASAALLFPRAAPQKCPATAGKWYRSTLRPPTPRRCVRRAPGVRACVRFDGGRRCEAGAGAADRCWVSKRFPLAITSIEFQPSCLARVAENAYGVLSASAAFDVDRSRRRRACCREAGHVANPEPNRVAPRRRSIWIDRRQPGDGPELDAGELLGQPLATADPTIDRALNVACE